MARSVKRACIIEIEICSRQLEEELRLEFQLYILFTNSILMQLPCENSHQIWIELSLLKSWKEVDDCSWPSSVNLTGQFVTGCENKQFKKKWIVITILNFLSRSKNASKNVISNTALRSRVVFNICCIWIGIVNYELTWLLWRFKIKMRKTY